MIPEYPAYFWLIAGIAVVFVGIAKAGFGGGVGIVATPLLALVIPVSDAAAILLPLLIVCDVFAVWHYRSGFHRRSVKLMLPGALIGISVGAFFFGFFSQNERMLQTGLGILCLVFVLFQATRVMIMGVLTRRHPHAAEGVLMGAVAGFTSTLAHAGGPPATIYLLPQQLDRRLFVGTTVIFFAAINQIKLIPYIGLDILGLKHLVTIAILAPLSYVGVKLGIFLNGRFTDLWFNRVVYSILFVSGIQLILGKSLFLWLMS
jgi:uncharacterized protein